METRFHLALEKTNHAKIFPISCRVRWFRFLSRIDQIENGLRRVGAIMKKPREILRDAPDRFIGLSSGRLLRTPTRSRKNEERVSSFKGNGRALRGSSHVGRPRASMRIKRYRDISRLLISRVTGRSSSLTLA